jgi:hypothetical protein
LNHCLRIVDSGKEVEVGGRVVVVVVVGYKKEKDGMRGGGFVEGGGGDKIKTEKKRSNRWKRA